MKTVSAFIAFIVSVAVAPVAIAAGSSAGSFKCPANPQHLDAAAYFAKHPLPAGTTTAVALKELSCFPAHTYAFGGK